jgi:hypothetical protein
MHFNVLIVCDVLPDAPVQCRRQPKNSFSFAVQKTIMFLFPFFTKWFRLFLLFLHFPATLDCRNSGSRKGTHFFRRPETGLKTELRAELSSGPETSAQETRRNKGTQTAERWRHRDGGPEVPRRADNGEETGQSDVHAHDQQNSASALVASRPKLAGPAPWIEGELSRRGSSMGYCGCSSGASEVRAPDPVFKGDPGSENLTHPAPPTYRSPASHGTD